MLHHAFQLDMVFEVLNQIHELSEAYAILLLYVCDSILLPSLHTSGAAAGASVLSVGVGVGGKAQELQGSQKRKARSVFL